MFYIGVKHSVEIVEQIHDLHGSAHGGDGGKTHDVTEVDGDLVKALGFYRLPGQKALGNGPEGVAMRGP